MRAMDDTVEDGVANRRITDLENSFVPERVFIERIRRNSKFVDASPDTVLHASDVVAVVARRHVLVSEVFAIGAEIEDRELLDFSVATADVVVTNRAVVDQTLPILPSSTGAASPSRSSSEVRKRSHSRWRRPCSVATWFASSAPHRTWSV